MDSVLKMSTAAGIPTKSTNPVFSHYPPTNPSPNGLFLMIFGHFRGLKLLFPGVSHGYKFALWNGI